jgi:hypothetical protein
MCDVGRVIGYNVTITVEAFFKSLAIQYESHSFMRYWRFRPLHYVARKGIHSILGGEGVLRGGASATSRLISTQPPFPSIFSAL